MNNERKTASIAKRLVILVTSLVLLCLQVLFIYMMFFEIRRYQLVYVIVNVIGYICVFRIYSKQMNSSYKMLWIIIILTLPFAGAMFYLLYGNSRGIPTRKSQKILNYLEHKIPSNNVLQEVKDIDSDIYKMAKYINTATGFPLYKNTEVSFFNETKHKHNELLNRLKKAKKFIFIEYFIVSDGNVLDDIIKILEEKGNEGIEIKFCYDDIGSNQVLKKDTIKRLSLIPNLQITSYEPLGININPGINFRDHRKLVIIDGEVCFVGGDNLADEYVNLIERFGYWRDNSVMLIGDAVGSFTVLFAQIWYMSTKETIDINRYVVKSSVINDSYVMPFGDGPVTQENVSYNLFRLMIGASKKTLYISTPYFIIDKDFISLIILAVKSGVDVKILLPHIPDKKGVFMMSRAHYGDILKAGGKIYEFSPGFNHAKNVIIDNMAFIGTVNIDYRSLFLHFECGTIITHDKVVEQMKEDFLSAIEKSEEITLEKWEKRSLTSKVLTTFLNILSPLL